jgi:replication factor C subunit 2/4
MSSKRLFIDFGCKNETTSTKPRINRHIKLPWTEKYRPNKVSNIILSETMKRKINEIVKNKDMPNIIITGHPGTGKTSTALCIAKLILKNKYKDGVMELNASDNRGLEIINNSIIHFCKKKLKIKECKHKIIILDEADNITKKAQNSLANLLEQYENTTRFVFTCNDTSKITESIQSRCLIFRYHRMSDDLLKERLIQICDKEKVKYTDKGIETLIFISQGDIRSAINNLESTYNGYGLVSEKNVYKICDQPQPMLITSIINSCLSGNIESSIIQINELKDNGYCNNDIVLTIINVLKEMNMNEDIKIKYIRIASETYINVNDGVNTLLQLYNCLAKMCDIVSK